MTKVNCLFFTDSKKSIDDQYAMECQPVIKPISWFSKIVRNKNITANEVSDALSKLEDFLDQKQFEKEEAVAELQLGHAFQELLEEKRYELLGLMTLKK